jgi:hypothetical protein
VRTSLLRMGVLTLTVLACGCATVPYHITSAQDYPGSYPLARNEPQVVTGAPNGFLDASDWFWPGSLLAKLLLWNGKVDSHQISDETVAAAVRFCREHELGDAMIRVNAYSVGDEWRRTFSNRNIHPLWRYPFGFVAWLGYTILPGRFFGGDNYNPYSNTINLYSDLKPIALHEAGHAQDFARQRYKGTYAFLYMIPFVDLYHEAVATSTALSYVETYGPLEEQKQACRLLYPAYGTYVGGNIGSYIFASWYWPIYLGSVGVGHAVGLTTAALLPENAGQDQAPTEAAQ